MANKRALGAIIGAISVVVIGVATPKPLRQSRPDQQNTEDRLPAAPGTPQQLPGSQ